MAANNDSGGDSKDRMTKPFMPSILRIPRLESRALKYGYSNARVKAMKGLILKSAFLEELIRVGSVEAMVELLQRTGYKNDLTAASVDYGGSALIEIAASRNFARMVKQLVKITPKSDCSALRALLIRWDLMNLKTMMHAKRLNLSYDEVRPHLFDVGGLNEEDFKKIMKADEANLMKELKRTRTGITMLSVSTMQLNHRMKERFTNAFRSLDMFLQMETIIDAYIYLFMESSLLKVGGADVAYIRGILRSEIDAKNVMIIERLKKHNVPKDKIEGSLIIGGTLPPQTIDKLMETKDIQSTLTVLKGKFRQLEISSPSLTGLEIAFEKSIAAHKMRAFRRAVLSVGAIFGFLLLKEEEISNLRKIAKGKEFGIPENEVREMLVVV